MSDIRINSKGLFYLSPSPQPTLFYLPAHFLSLFLKDPSSLPCPPIPLFGLAKSCNISDLDVFKESILLYVTEVGRVKVLYGKLGDKLSQIENNKQKDIKQMRQDIAKEGVSLVEVDIGSNFTHGTIHPGVNYDENQPLARFSVNTPFTYQTTFDVDNSTGKATLIDKEEINGKKFDSQKYEMTTVYAPTSDGIQIPITLVHKKRFLGRGNLPTRLSEPSKLLLKTYGCYGMSNLVEFDIGNWSLLERGWIIAYPHVRGGQELGKSWHTDAIGVNKYKTVEDIEACANYLIAEGFTHSSLLCGTSNSAGAGMMASAMNLNPSLFKAVYLSVPFLDIKGSLMQPDLPLSQSDYHEFGNPLENAQAYDSLTALCPLTNLRNEEYPAVLMNTYFSDYRTPIWHSLKYAKRFREVTKPSSRVRRINGHNIAIIAEEGSHKGMSDEDINLERTALTTAYFEWVVEDMSNDIEKTIGKSFFSRLLN